jgi:TRAP-type C4-dicarboxylate transport system substrate-binding protein
MRTPETQREIESLEKEYAEAQRQQAQAEAKTSALRLRLETLKVQNPIPPDEEAMKILKQINDNLPPRRTKRNDRTIEK